MTELLPPFPFRHRLIPVIHEVVPARFGPEGPGLCVAYALVTALAANAALEPSGEPYDLQAGRVFVRLPGRADPGLSPSTEDADGLVFHAWAGRRHPSGRREVADLSTRHFNEWAAGAGIRLEARIPRAVWAWEDEVPKAFRYTADSELTLRVRDSLRRARGEAVAVAVREVLGRIGAPPA